MINWIFQYSSRVLHCLWMYLFYLSSLSLLLLFTICLIQSIVDTTKNFRVVQTSYHIEEETDCRVNRQKKRRSMYLYLPLERLIIQASRLAPSILFNLFLIMRVFNKLSWPKIKYIGFTARNESQICVNITSASMYFRFTHARPKSNTKRPHKSIQLNV